MAKRTNLDALGKLAEDRKRKKGAANGGRIAWKGADGSSFTITPSKGQGPGTEDWDNAVGTANKAFEAGKTGPAPAPQAERPEGHWIGGMSHQNTPNVPPAQIQDETGKVIDNPARAEYRAKLTAQMDAFKAKRGEFERGGKMSLEDAKAVGMTKYAATLAGGKTYTEQIGDLQEEKEKQAGATGRTEKTIASNEQITEMISQREASKDKAEMARLDKEIAAAKEKQGVEIKQKTVEVDQRFEIESAKLKQAAADKTDANKQAMAKHDLGIYKIKGELYKSLLGAWYEADAGPEKDALLEQAQALYKEMQGLAGGGAMGGAAAQPPPQPTTQPTTQPSQEGQAPPTATNPQTGEQLVFKDGIWQ